MSAIIAGECWLPVVGYEGAYEVSDHGRVRSVDRIVSSRRNIGLVQRRMRGVVLRPGLTYGYTVITLGRDNRSHRVHTLVLTAFVGPAPAGHECCHGDGIRTNNHLSNLRWGTRSDNVRDAIRHGSHRGFQKADSERAAA